MSYYRLKFRREKFIRGYIFKLPVKNFATCVEIRDEIEVITVFENLSKPHLKTLYKYIFSSIN